MATLTSSGSFTVTEVALETAQVTVPVLPSVGYPTGFGRLVHPTLGAMDYDIKPDKWVNIDGDVIPGPVWALTKTLGGSASSLWPGQISDVICQEIWGEAQDGMTMPVAMLRRLLAFWTTPVDPSVGLVQWFPNYVSNKGFNVILADLTVGSGGSGQMARVSGLGQQTIAMTDLVHAKNPDGSNNGWVSETVSLSLKIVGGVSLG
jgi:hypothetical protein